MRPALLKYRHALREKIRYSRFLRDCAAQVELWRSNFRPPLSEQRLMGLAQCYGRATRPSTLRATAAALRQVVDSPANSQALMASQRLSQYAEFVDKHPAVMRTIPVKAPGPNGEKGVILSYFEFNSLSMLRGIRDYAEFAKRWTVIRCASWTPTDYSLLGLTANLSDEPVYIQPANYSEVAKLKAFHPKIRCVPGLACDWVHPAFYAPRPWKERDIDILMVANWAPFKRHWEFFDALRKMPAHLRVVCIGQPEHGRTVENIKDLARQFKVPQQIEFTGSIPIDTVTDYQCRSKISAIFSLWEGGCVAAVEAIFAGAVLAMRKGASVGASAHVNDITGIVLDPRTAHLQLMKVLESEGTPEKAHAWAAANISSYATIGKIGQMLREDAQRAGQPWTTEMIEPCWRPYPRLVNPQDAAALEPACRELHEHYPEVFPNTMLSISAK